MLNPFACGGFTSQEEYDLDELLSPCSTPKRSRKSSSGKDNKNPYADRGLDKFSALLAELEGKKQKIYTQKGSEDISFVRFVYSGSNNWRPIVVKSKDRKPDSAGVVNHGNNAKDKQNAQSSEAVQDKHAIEAVNGGHKEELSAQVQKKRSVSWGDLELIKNLSHPYYHLPLVMLLIMLLLAVYGRSFAILCTSLGWYLVPMIKERSSSGNPSSDKARIKKDYARKLSDKSMASSGGSVIPSDNKTKNKKDLTRRFSEKNMGVSNNNNDRSSPPRSPRLSSSPKSVLAGLGEKPTGRHSHKKSW